MTDCGDATRPEIANRKKADAELDPLWIVDAVSRGSVYPPGQRFAVVSSDFKCCPCGHLLHRYPTHSCRTKIVDSGARPFIPIPYIKTGRYLIDQQLY